MTPAKLKKFKKLTDHLFNEITEDDILVFDKETGVFTVAGQQLPDELVKGEIINQAAVIRETYLWQMLLKDMKYTANKAIYLSSKTTDDLLFPKAQLFVIDVLEKKLKNLAKMAKK